LILPDPPVNAVATTTEQGVTGGAADDALVAATAANAGLITCDRRAAGVYDAYDVPFQLLG
jgi:hypothetical protein